MDYLDYFVTNRSHFTKNVVPTSRPWKSVALKSSWKNAAPEFGHSHRLHHSCFLTHSSLVAQLHRMTTCFHMTKFILYKPPQTSLRSREKRSLTRWVVMTNISFSTVFWNMATAITMTIDLGLVVSVLRKQKPLYWNKVNFSRSGWVAGLFKPKINAISKFTS